MLNSVLLNNEWVIKKIKEEIKKFLETNENELTTTQKLWQTANTVLPKKYKNISNKQSNPTPTKTQETTTNIAQSKQKEGNNQDQSRVK